MSALDPALIRIDHVLLRNARAGDAPRLTRALDGLTPASIGLSPCATLIVRRLTLATRLARTGSSDRFVAGLRDDLRARTVSARRGRGCGREDEDLLFEDNTALETAIVEEWLEAGPHMLRKSWVHALGAGMPLTRWRQFILPDYQLVPRLIARLVDAGIAERWLLNFDSTEIRTAAVRMLAHHGAAPVPTENDSKPRPETQRVPPAGSARTRAHLREIARVAPEARTIVGHDVRRLVTLALIIVRRPALIAMQAFVEGLEQFAAAPTSVDASSGGKRANYLGTSINPSARRAKLPLTATPKRRGRLTTQHLVANIPTLIPTAPSTGPAPPAPEHHRAIHSVYGGLFFLLNSFLALKLYGDFTRPGDLLKGLSPFELMHILGTRWCGARFAADPIAALLLELAGLEPDAKPGQTFEPPVWTVPDDWLLPWPDAERNRLRFPFSGAVPCTPHRWLNYFARYLSARLQKALDSRDAVSITCMQPGRVALDHDRISVHFPLADHPIILRFAGLDRDPGWVPAASRFIEFSFT